MIIQRKRVAKRLASGLLAGALALGGLAISGATPVSAETPTTNRIAGVDRYDTSVALALATATPVAIPGAVDHIVLASGENFPDALAASGYAGKLTGRSVIILTRAGELPETVVNYLSNTANFSASLAVHAIGGTTAISDAVLTEIKSITGVTATRVSGDTRYGTAVAMSKLMGNSTKVILVSGENFADGVAVSGWAYNTEQAVLLSGPNGLDAGTQAEIKRLATATPNLEVIIIGGTAAVPDQSISDLVEQGVKYSKINRIAGDDRYATAVALNAYLAINLAGAGGFNGSQVALITGTNFADALAAAPYLGSNAIHTVLMPASGIPASVAGLAVALAPNNPTSLVAIGGFAVIPNATVAAVRQAVSDLGIIRPTLTAAEGVATASMSVTFPTGLAPTVEAGGCTNPVCLSSESVSKWLAEPGNYLVNGIPLVSFAGTSVTTAVDGTNAQKLNITITMPVGFTVPGVTLSFPGIAEGAASDNGTFSIASASATIVDDATAPTLTVVKATANSGATAGPTAGAGLVYLLASEPITGFAAADVTVKTLAGADKCANIVVNDAGSGAYALACLNPAPQAFVAGDVITIALDGFQDTAGNLGGAVGATQTITVAAADTTKPTLTRGAVTVTGATATEFVVALSTGTLTVSSLAGSSLHGQGGLGWRLLIQSTSSNIPTVTVDDAAKRVVVTANFAKHSGDDIAHAIQQNAATKAAIVGVVSATHGDNKLSPTYISGDQVAPTAGQSTTSIVLNASEVLNPAVPLDAADFGNASCSGLSVAYGALNLSVVVSCTASATPFSGLITLAAEAVTDLVFNTSDANATGI